MANAKPISDLVASLLRIALNYVERQLITKIDDEDARAWANLHLSPLRQTIADLNDDNPENREQVLLTWRKFLNTDFSDQTSLQLSKWLDKIGNPDTREVLAYVLGEVVNTLRLLTDEDADNSEQLKATWTAFVKNPVTHGILLEHLLRPALEGTKMDENTIAFILELVAEALKLGTSQIPNKEAIADKLLASVA